MEHNELIEFLISHGGRPDDMSWYEVGVKFGVSPPNKEKALRDEKYRRESISKRVNDIWRKHIKENRPKKRLFYDIEVSYGIFSSWSTGFNITLTEHDMIKEPAIICVSWMWEGDREVHNLTWDNGNDEQLTRRFCKVLEEADEIVAHNGDRFDIRWIRARALKYNVYVPMSLRMYDTYKASKKLFRLPSHRLDSIAKYLGIGRKNNVSKALWDRVILNNDQDALKEMVEYCDQDVRVLAAVYAKISKYSESKTRISSEGICPECGSDNCKEIYCTRTRSGLARYDIKCLSCGTIFKRTKPLK